jgi:UDP-N-acetylmuramate--L-alanine ligase
MTRDAITIGAGLMPARQARAIRPGERIHVVGAAGAGASAAALLGRAAGAAIDGCDPGYPSPYTAALDAVAIPVAPGHDPRHVDGTLGPSPDRLAVTKALTAVDPDHPELVAARERGIPLEPWQQVIADAAVDRRLVAIAGTHGKSTTAGWLVHVLVEAGLDPAAFVGALLPSAITGGPPGTARWGGGAPFVVEADEYAGNFDAYRPQIVALTSIEWDHPDVFADLAAVQTTFRAWLDAMPPDGTVVANIADPGVLTVIAAMPSVPERSLWRVGLAADDRPAQGDVKVVGRVIAEDPAGTTITIDGLGRAEPTLRARLPTAGRHNAANALLVATVAHRLGVPSPAIARGLASFPGVGRRLERKGEAAGVVVYDDYGHHPTAIRATIEAVRQREPTRRLWAVYEPLTYHRTAALLDEFAVALAGADAVAIADIWPGRDPDTTVATPAGLAEAVARSRPGIPVDAPGSVEATADWLRDEVQAGDVVLVMGGGRSYRIGERLLELLAEAR